MCNLEREIALAKEKVYLLERLKELNELTIAPYIYPVHPWYPTTGPWYLTVTGGKA